MERSNEKESTPKNKKDYLHDLIKIESNLTKKIRDNRCIAYRSSFNILGVVLSGGILASGSILLSIVTLILFTPLSLALTSHDFEKTDYIKAMNPIKNLMIGISPAVSYLEMIKLRNKNRETIKSHLNSVGKVSRDEVLEMLSMLSNDNVKLIIFNHYAKNV